MASVVHYGEMAWLQRIDEVPVDLIQFVTLFFLQLTTFVFLLTLVTSFSGTVAVGHHPLTAALYARLPETHREWVHSRLRAAIFVAIFALLFTAACLILDISRLAALMPLHVDKLVGELVYMCA